MTMDTKFSVLSTFNYYMKNYGVDSKIDGIDTRVFFKEEDNKTGIDEKYIYTPITNGTGVINQGSIIESLGCNWIAIDKPTNINGCFDKTYVKKCNSIMKIVLEETLYQFPILLDTKTLDVTTGGVFSIVDGKISVTLKTDTNTNKIKIDDRVILMKKQAFIVEGIDISIEGLTTLNMSSTAINTATDSIELGIADVNKLVNYSISIVNPVEEITVNSTYNILVEAKKENVIDTSPTLTFSTSNSDVATIDQSGLITALSNGYITITVDYNNRAVTTFNLEIVTSHSINVVDGVSSLKIGNSKTIILECITNNVVDISPVIAYSSDNTNNVIVSNLGVVSALNVGTANITIKYFDKIVVMPVNIENIAYLVSITNKVTSLGIGNTLQLTSTCKIDGVADTYPIISYTSSDINILTVSSTGLVTAIGTGSANISCNYNGSSDTMSVVVAQTDTYTCNFTTATTMDIRTGMSKTFTAHYFKNSVEVSTGVSNVSWSTVALDGVSATTYATIKTVNGIISCTILGNNNISLTGDFLLKLNAVIDNIPVNYNGQIKLKTL